MNTELFICKICRPYIWDWKWKEFKYSETTNSKNYHFNCKV